jgi:beta-lactamase class D
MMDDQKEAEKWEHLKDLRLWMKHVVGLMSDIVNNGLGQAFFVRIPILLLL